MKLVDLIKEEQLISFENDKANAIAIPSRQQMKYIIGIQNKNAFFAGLRMLGTRTLKALVGKTILSVIYQSGLLKYLLKKNLVMINENNELIEAIRKDYQGSTGINIYVGSAKSRNLSLTLQVVSQGNEYYVRYPMSKTSEEFTAKEIENINFLNQQRIQCPTQQVDKMITLTQNPTPLYAYKGIPRYKTSTSLCVQKMKLLRQLASNETETLQENTFFIEQVQEIKRMLVRNALALSPNLLPIFEKIVSGLKNISLKKAFFHGDFSPDNILKSSGKLYLIDFEYSQPLFFACFDLFHYLYKAKKFHLKIISLQDIKIIDTYLKKTYNGYPYSLKDESNSLVLVKLYIFYLFLLLKRFLVDEQIKTANPVIERLQTSIHNLFVDSKL
ncbi:phosphotransferase family protein [Legionella hackeliae]|uniref:Aminoglycoside phosphotransferase domain-containing protein n=1 Tax=Legionella hackeliae TaxID=449 RepID=A0A0A8UNB8_LEGHA|nr:phosphotransferase [Legionella hackeliae]KTD08805.1 Choline/ethanolamine kinase [Legionella hackeliae]CEK10233.1 protein of unknown function [Legionella hackeliae]STX46962.1 Choline/ethanolamine kinase [Legionella hackeliae]